MYWKRNIKLKTNTYPLGIFFYKLGKDYYPVIEAEHLDPANGTIAKRGRRTERREEKEGRKEKERKSGLKNKLWGERC